MVTPVLDSQVKNEPRNSNFRKPLHLLRMHLAKQYVKLYPKETFVGITGSIGKTICVEAANAVLSQRFKTLKTESNLDPIISIPKTLLKLTPQIKKVILEMGIDRIGEMD